jgi:hypothetical protein
MDIAAELASARGVRGEGPNIDLAERLAHHPDRAAIGQLEALLAGEDPRLSGDALTVVRELAAQSPAQVDHLAPVLAPLLSSDVNRVVWGAAEAMHVMSRTMPRAVAPYVDSLMEAVRHGSVITCDHGIGAIGNVAAARPEAVPFILGHLRTCGARYVPLRADRAIAAVTAQNVDEFLLVLDARATELDGNAAARLRRVRKAVVARGRR